MTWKNPPASDTMRRELRLLYADLLSVGDVSLNRWPFAGTCDQQRRSRELVWALRSVKRDFQDFLGAPLVTVEDTPRHRPQPAWYGTDGKWHWSCSCAAYIHDAPTRELAEQRIDYHLAGAYSGRYAAFPA